MSMGRLGSLYVRTVIISTHPPFALIDLKQRITIFLLELLILLVVVTVWSVRGSAGGMLACL